VVDLEKPIGMKAATVITHRSAGIAVANVQ